jgi:hypothetical protein
MAATTHWRNPQHRYQNHMNFTLPRSGRYPCHLVLNQSRVEAPVRQQGCVGA